MLYPLGMVSAFSTHDFFLACLVLKRYPEVVPQVVLGPAFC